MVFIKYCCMQKEQENVLTLCKGSKREELRWSSITRYLQELCGSACPNSVFLSRLPHKNPRMELSNKDRGWRRFYLDEGSIGNRDRRIFGCPLF